MRRRLAFRMDETDPPEPAAEPKRPLIKRRWAIVGRAGGGAALLAVTGALALADPNDQTDPGSDGSGGDVEISAQS